MNTRFDTGRARLAASVAFGILMLAGAATADTLLTGGVIFTANKSAPAAEAIGISGDKIVAVGSRADVEAALKPGFDTIDLGGKMLLPGLIDSHVHTMFGGFSQIGAMAPYELADAAGVADFASTASANGTGKIGDALYLMGFQSSIWSDIPALSAIFDQPPFADMPVVLAGIDGHTGWVNKAMREKSGVTKAFIASLPADEAVFFGTDANGEPNGFGAETGWAKLASALPAAPEEVSVKAVELGIQTLNALGVTGFLDPVANVDIGKPIFGSSPPASENGAFAGYKALSDAGKLNAHVTGLVLLSPHSKPEDLAIYDAVKDRFAGVKDVMVGGVKIFADGVIEYPAQSASLSKPYSNTGQTGPRVINTDDFKALVSALDKRGGLLHVHAIGDQAVTDALDAIAAARAANGNSGIPHTITHLEVVQPADFPRFAELGVIASMQLFWAQEDEYTNELLKPYLDPELYQHIYPARSIRDAGGTIAGATDWPVDTASPFLEMAVGIARSDGTHPPFLPDQTLTNEDMLYAFTLNAARAARIDAEAGSIEVGKSADFALVDQNLLTADPATIAETQVLWTMFEGRKVYEQPK